MSQLIEISLKSGMKRLISGLICLIMVSATLPIHILNDAVCFAKEESVNVILNSLPLADDWFEREFSCDKVAAADNINIILCDDLTLYGDNYSKNCCQRTCLFDFTDSRFAGKVININGFGKKLTLQNKNLFFMDIRDCVVNLNDVSLDGANLQRTDSYIKINEPSSGQKSVLNMNAGCSVSGCCANVGAAVLVDKNSILNMNANSHIVGCFATSGGAICANENSTINMNLNSSVSKCFATNGSGGAIYARFATINMCENSAIIGCKSAGSAGAIYAYCSKVTMNDRSMICGCENKFGSGGAMCSNGGTVTMHDNSRIGGCKAESGDGGAIYAVYSTIIMNANSGIFECSAKNGYGGAICLHHSTVDMNDVSGINGCLAKDGGAIYAYGGTVNINGKSSVMGCFCAFGGRINIFDNTVNFLDKVSNISRGSDLSKPFAPHKLRVGVPRVSEDLDKYELDESDFDISRNVDNIPYSKPRNVFSRFNNTANFSNRGLNISRGSDLSKPFAPNKLRVGMPRVSEDLDKYELDESDFDISRNVDNIPYSKPRNVSSRFNNTANFSDRGLNVNQKTGFSKPFAPHKLRLGVPRVSEDLDKYELDESDFDISRDVDNIPYSKPRNVFSRFNNTANFSDRGLNVNQKTGFSKPFAPNKLRVGMPRVSEDLDKYELDESDFDISRDVENISYGRPKKLGNIPDLRLDPFAIFWQKLHSDRAESSHDLSLRYYPKLGIRDMSGSDGENIQNVHKYKLIFEVAGDASDLPEQVLYANKGDEIYVPQYIGYHLSGLKCGIWKIDVDDGKFVLNRNIVKRADQNNVITLVADWNINNYMIKYISDEKIVKIDNQNIMTDIKYICKTEFLAEKPGYVFSHWTYGDDNVKLVDGKTQWLDLIESSGKDRVIILIAHFKKMV